MMVDRVQFLKSPEDLVFLEDSQDPKWQCLQIYDLLEENDII